MRGKAWATYLLPFFGWAFAVIHAVVEFAQPHAARRHHVSNAHIVVLARSVDPDHHGNGWRRACGERAHHIASWVQCEIVPEIM